MSVPDLRQPEALQPGQVVLSRLDGWAEGVNVRSEGGNPHLMVNVKSPNLIEQYLIILGSFCPPREPGGRCGNQDSSLRGP